MIKITTTQTRAGAHMHTSHFQRNKYGEPNSPYTEKFDDEESSSHNLCANDGRVANCSNAAANQKPEWKRYKQYTRQDLNDAIQAVKGGMSALQASRLYKVPSRTLYDKVKKMGIVGTRPMNRAIKRSPSNNGSPASFPYGISGTRSSPIAHHLEAQSHAHSMAGDGENGDELEQRERGRGDLQWPAIDPSLLFNAIQTNADIASRAAALAAANGFKGAAGRQSSESPPAPAPGIYQGSTSTQPMSPPPHDDDDDEDEESRYELLPPRDVQITRRFNLLRYKLASSQ